MAVISMGVRENDLQPLAVVTDGKRLFEVQSTQPPTRNHGIMGGITMPGRVFLEDQVTYLIVEVQLPLGKIWRLIRKAPVAPDYV